MKKLTVTLFAVAAILTVAISAVAADKGRYLVSASHTPEQCLAALDAFAAQGKEPLARFDWGCMSGDHTGYALVEASSAEAALAAVPANQRAQAKAIKLDKFTIEQIKSLHAK
jgi:hypothetical protein